jgi:hypothetical protein
VDASNDCGGIAALLQLNINMGIMIVIRLELELDQRFAQSDTTLYAAIETSWTWHKLSSSLVPCSIDLGVVQILHKNSIAIWLSPI